LPTGSDKSRLLGEALASALLRRAEAVEVMRLDRNPHPLLLLSETIGPEGIDNWAELRNFAAGISLVRITW